MSDDALAGKLKRTELQHKPSSTPGREIVQVLTEIPVGVESGWHTHPGEEVGYILAGTVEMKIHGQPSLLLNAGDPFLMPPGPSSTADAPTPRRYGVGDGLSVGSNPHCLRSCSTCSVRRDLPAACASATVPE